MHLAEPQTSNKAVVIWCDENGERVFPCRCGETHRGPYGLYDYGHHNCFHRAPLVRSPVIERVLWCPECGEVFEVSPEVL